MVRDPEDINGSKDDDVGGSLRDICGKAVEYIGGGPTDDSGIPETVLAFGRVLLIDGEAERAEKKAVGSVEAEGGRRGFGLVGEAGTPSAKVSLNTAFTLRMIALFNSSLENV